MGIEPMTFDLVNFRDDGSCTSFRLFVRKLKNDKCQKMWCHLLTPVSCLENLKIVFEKEKALDFLRTTKRSKSGYRPRPYHGGRKKISTNKELEICQLPHCTSIGPLFHELSSIRSLPSEPQFLLSSHFSHLSNIHVIRLDPRTFRLKWLLPSPTALNMLASPSVHNLRPKLVCVLVCTGLMSHQLSLLPILQ